MLYDKRSSSLKDKIIEKEKERKENKARALKSKEKKGREKVSKKK